MNWKWIFLMAWRDSRKDRNKLFLFISSIILGIASLVALKSFNENLERDIDNQAAELIGADLELESNVKPSNEALLFIDSLNKLSIEHASEERFMSMLNFPKQDGSRFVQVRAVRGNFPFYGALKGEPNKGVTSFGKQPGVLLDKAILLQFEASTLDTVSLGNNSYPILGALTSQPGQSFLFSALAPSLWIPLEQLENAGLQQTGSRIEYHYYFKLPKNFAIDKKLEEWKDKLSLLKLRSSTIQTTKENVGRSFADMGNYMELVGFVALLLGCIGVSSAVQIYVREKLVSVAILRCLGANAKQAYYIFLVQFAVIGLLGGIIGALLGAAVQFIIPWVMQDVLPVTLSSSISWFAITEGIILGVFVAILFALLPLMAVRKISPLNSLRIDEKESSNWKDRSNFLIYLLIIAFILIFARLQMDNWIETIGFTVGILVVFLILYIVARSFTLLIRKFFPTNWSYLWRQGLSNLYRPNNQTVILIISIGLGTTLIASLFFIQNIIIDRVKMSSEDSQTNMLMFDIQPSQRDSIRLIAEKQGYKLEEEVPIVTMSLEQINGIGLKEILKDTTEDRSTRGFRGEIRATYRNELSRSEQITSGKWVGEVKANDTASVSLDKGYAENIKAKVGDVLVFNVQGLLIPSKVSSIREVDWNRFQSNFRVVFAKGTIDRAPQFYLMMTKVDGEEKSIAFQQSIVNHFPNVSVLDLNAVLKALNNIFDKISFIIQFIASFSILTAIIVLISSVRMSKFQRIKENVLLRTLGASSKQIYWITISEYFFLGLLAVITGLVLALSVSYVLASIIFKAIFVPSIGFICLLLVLVPLITVIIGLINSLAILNKPPLEVIRRS